MTVRGLNRCAPSALMLLCFTAGLPVAKSLAAGKAEKDAMQLTSIAFTEGAPIPAQYSCEGTNVSPPLEWSGAPAGAKSLVLIADDPDAPLLRCRLRANA